MDDSIRPSALAADVGISVSYASELLSGKRRPARSLALVIFERTKLKLGLLAGLSNDDAETLLRIETARAVSSTDEQAK